MPNILPKIFSKKLPVKFANAKYISKEAYFIYSKKGLIDTICLQSNFQINFTRICPKELPNLRISYINHTIRTRLSGVKFRSLTLNEDSQQLRESILEVWEKLFKSLEKAFQNFPEIISEACGRFYRSLEKTSQKFGKSFPEACEKVLRSLRKGTQKLAEIFTKAWGKLYKSLRKASQKLEEAFLEARWELPRSSDNTF